MRDVSLQLVDVGFSRSAVPGFVLAARLIAPDNITMTSGAPLPLGVVPKDGRANLLRQLVDTTKSLLAPSRTPEERSEATAALINSCLKTGAASQIAYEEPGAEFHPSPPRLSRPAPPSSPTGRIGRNAPCPCGSGKKFKHCCGARR